MVIALLVILGVDLIVLVGFLASVLGRKRWITGAVDGFRPKWTRGYGRWVHDVLFWAKAPFLFRNELIAIDSVGEHRPAAPGDVKRLGSDPVIVVLKAGTATVEIAAHSDDLDRVSGPFRPAEAGHV
jgi:hypothetical protein